MQPNFSDPRIQKTIESGLAWAASAFSTNKIRPCTSTLMRKQLSPLQFTTGKYLRDTIFKCTDTSYHYSSTNPRPGKCMEWMRNEEGFKVVLSIAREWIETRNPELVGSTDEELTIYLVRKHTTAEDKPDMTIEMLKAAFGAETDPIALLKETIGQEIPTPTLDEAAADPVVFENEHGIDAKTVHAMVFGAVASSRSYTSLFKAAIASGLSYIQAARAMYKLKCSAVYKKLVVEINSLWNALSAMLPREQYTWLPEYNLIKAVIYDGRSKYRTYVAMIIAKIV